MAPPPGSAPGLMRYNEEVTYYSCIIISYILKSFSGRIRTILSQEPKKISVWHVFQVYIVETDLCSRPTVDQTGLLGLRRSDGAPGPP